MTGRHLQSPLVGFSSLRCVPVHWTQGSRVGGGGASESQQRSRRSMAMNWGLILVMLSTSGCHRPNPISDQPASIESDSMGVTIVLNHEPDESFSVLVNPAASVRIDGRAEGALLHNVVGAGRLSDGRVAVMNGAPVQIRIHLRSGQLQHAFSQQGQGPFEFRAPVHFRVLPGDTIVGWDAMFGSAYGFLPAGASVLERHTDLGRMHAALGSTEHAEGGKPLPGLGYLVKVGIETSHNESSTRAAPGWQRLLGRVKYVIVTQDYQRIDLGTFSNSPTVLRREPHGWVAPMYFYLSHSAHAAGDERIYLSDATEDRIDAWDLDGKLRVSIRRAREVRELEDSAFQAEYVRWRARYIAIPEEEFTKAVALLPPLRQLPPILGLLTDPRGWVWSRDALDAWSVFDKHGRWLTTVPIPLHRVYEIGQDYVLGVELDEDDVPSVVELPLSIEPRNLSSADAMRRH